MVFFHEEKFRLCQDIVKASALSCVKISCITRNLFLEKIEGALCVWFKDGVGGWHGAVQGGA
jgi:hypothetical protein